MTNYNIPRNDDSTSVPYVKGYKHGWIMQGEQPEYWHGTDKDQYLMGYWDGQGDRKLAWLG